MRETEKAVLFEVIQVGEDDPLTEPKTSWFPFSQMKTLVTHPSNQDEDTLLVTQWIASTKDLV